MPEPYPITRIQPEWLPVHEHMGTKRKFWYRDPRGQTDWLFKYPRPNTGEHWAEKIAAEVAARLGIMCAKVELAADDGHRGSTSLSFLSASEELVHGNQLLRWTLDGYDPDLRFGQSEHSFGNIWRCLGRLFVEPEAGEVAKRRFGEYLVLDAVIGNTDRHHENWGLIRKRRGDGWIGRLAPSFDHASSLGRELLDGNRAGRMEADTVGAYDSAGLPIRVPHADGLRIAGIESERVQGGNGAVLLVRGVIENTIENSRTVPTLQAVLVDEAGTELHRWRVAAVATVLDGGQTTTFESWLAEPPEGAARVTVGFVVEDRG